MKHTAEPEAGRSPEWKDDGIEMVTKEMGDCLCTDDMIPIEVAGIDFPYPDGFRFAFHKVRLCRDCLSSLFHDEATKQEVLRYFDSMAVGENRRPPDAKYLTGLPGRSYTIGPYKDGSTVYSVKDYKAAIEMK